MDKFEFLLGNWNLEYRIPESVFSAAGSDSGTGSFKRALNDKYVFFEYSTKSGSEAKGIFAWDDKGKDIQILVVRKFRQLFDGNL